jgi:ABC-2 type transport system ATP-binding protein
MADAPPAVRLASVRMSFPSGLPGRLSLRRAPRKPVLGGIDLELAQGCLTALSGPNGSGKTTVLRLIAGLLLPDSGSVSVFGMDPVRSRSKTAGLTGLSLSGDRSFYWRLSARANLEYFGALQGLWGRALKSRMAETLAALGLERDSEKPVEVLSAGYRQRLALARAIIHSPKLLLLDEPFRSLDEESSAAFTSLLEELVGAGTAVLIATPSTEEAGRISRSVFELRGGLAFEHREIP